VAPPQGAVPTDLWRLHLEIAAADVEKLRGYFWNGRRGQRPEERPEVLARVREGGAVYENVAVHLKGAAGSFRPFDDKPALTLNFSKHAPGQRFHGYSKLSLNNSVQDPTYLCEAISRELFAAAGVPVPRVDHVTVLINGRDLGLYVLAEGWGRPFLRRHFANVDGNLYDGGFLQEITAELDTNSGENRTDHGALERLRVAAFELEAATRAERLAGALDLDRFFRFLAMEIMTCHWDGYAMNRNNYRLFHDRERERMVFLPHGLDQMFGVHRSSPTSPILPAMQGLVANAVLSLPGAPERLREQIAALRAEVFLPERLTNRVQELARRIRPTLAAYAPELAEVHDAHVAALCRRIVARAASISAQLAGEAPVVVEEPGRRRANRWPAGD
jgi:spore coat protein CotH